MVHKLSCNESLKEKSIQKQVVLLSQMLPQMLMLSPCLEFSLLKEENRQAHPLAQTQSSSIIHVYEMSYTVEDRENYLSVDGAKPEHALMARFIHFRLNASFSDGIQKY